MFVYDLNRRLPIPQNGGLDNVAPKLASLLDEDSNFNVRAVERGSRIVV